MTPPSSSPKGHLDESIPEVKHQKQHHTHSDRDLLITLIRVIADDPKLHLWFLTLEKAPKNFRYSELRRMAQSMRTQSSHPELVDIANVMEHLTDDHLFNSVYHTLETLHEGAE